MIWERIHKGNSRGRVLADSHYTRQSSGNPLWTRPGYNACLYASHPDGSGDDGYGHGYGGGGGGFGFGDGDGCGYGCGGRALREPMACGAYVTEVMR